MSLKTPTCGTNPPAGAQVAWLGMVLGVCVLLMAACAAFASPRQIASIDGGWRFIRQDVPGAEALAFDDRTWQRISLPHTINGEGDGMDKARHYRGPAWYRKTVTHKVSPGTPIPSGPPVQAASLVSTIATSRPKPSVATAR